MGTTLMTSTIAVASYCLWMIQYVVTSVTSGRNSPAECALRLEPRELAVTYCASASSHRLLLSAPSSTAPPRPSLAASPAATPAAERRRAHSASPLGRLLCALLLLGYLCGSACASTLVDARLTPWLPFSVLTQAPRVTRWCALQHPFAVSTLARPWPATLPLATLASEHCLPRVLWHSFVVPTFPRPLARRSEFVHSRSWHECGVRPQSRASCAATDDVSVLWHSFVVLTFAHPLACRPLVVHPGGWDECGVRPQPRAFAL